MPEKQDARREQSRVPTAASVLADGTLIEVVCRGGRTGLAVFQGDHTRLVDSYAAEDGRVLVPISGGNNLIKHGAVLLPEEPVEYGSTSVLIEEIARYLDRYVDLSLAFREIAAYYVLLSWVYDAFNELPYLRVRGDYGSGKTRALIVLGAICYRPFFASGASTVSPIFHTIDTFRGTLVFDEADFRFSDEKAELVKIFNNGNVRGFPVFRTAMTPKREFDPIAFTVFGPKFVGMRSAFGDRALESRFLTEEMGQRRVRPDIPLNLPESQATEAQELRNKLLMYRFRSFKNTHIDARVAAPNLSHRLNQILVPLLSVVPSAAARDRIVRSAAQLERDFQSERSITIEARVLEVLRDLMTETTGGRVTLAEITNECITRFSTEVDRPLTNRYIGSILQRRLHLFAYKSHGVFVVPCSEAEKVSVLCDRYGIEVAAKADG